MGCMSTGVCTSRLYSTLKVDMPGAEDLNRDSKMEAALGWCCCLETIDGEREPVPWPSVKSVFYRKKRKKNRNQRDKEDFCNPAILSPNDFIYTKS